MKHRPSPKDCCATAALTRDKSYHFGLQKHRDDDLICTKLQRNLHAFSFPSQKDTKGIAIK
ncbi:MAG: hypothetical protein D8B50_08810 [Prevotella sp.]|nr:MAG: hypothetical protein D8B50_08810 [Prevotella sp.]